MLRTSRAEGERDSREEAQEDQGASAFALRGYGVTMGQELGVCPEAISGFAYGSQSPGSVGRWFGGRHAAFGLKEG
jgi:hypothetical protein